MLSIPSRIVRRLETLSGQPRNVYQTRLRNSLWIQLHPLRAVSIGVGVRIRVGVQPRVRIPDDEQTVVAVDDKAATSPDGPRYLLHILFGEDLFPVGVRADTDQNTEAESD